MNRYIARPVYGFAGINTIIVVGSAEEEWDAVLLACFEGVRGDGLPAGLRPMGLRHPLRRHDFRILPTLSSCRRSIGCWRGRGDSLRCAYEDQDHAESHYP